MFSLWLHLFLQPEEELDPEERDNFLQQLYKFMEDRGNTELLLFFNYLFNLMSNFLNGFLKLLLTVMDVIMSIFLCQWKKITANLVQGETPIFTCGRSASTTLKHSTQRKLKSSLRCFVFVLLSQNLFYANNPC